MIKSIKIPENINIKILKKNNINLIILKNNSSELIESRELFFISKYNIFINNRIVLSNKHTINIIKQGINNLNLWNKRKILLQGVGSKVDIKDNVLTIKVSNTSKSFDIPEDITVKIINSPMSIMIWSVNINIIDEFKNKIFNNLPKKSLSIIN